MKNENLEKIYLEKNKTSPLLKTPEKDFQKCPWSSFFLRDAISNLDTLIYTDLWLKKCYRIGPRCKTNYNKFEI